MYKICKKCGGMTSSGSVTITSCICRPHGGWGFDISATVTPCTCNNGTWVFEAKDCSPFPESDKSKVKKDWKRNIYKQHLKRKHKRFSWE